MLAFEADEPHRIRPVSRPGWRGSGRGASGRFARRPAAHAEYTKGLGAAAFEPEPFLTWAARMGGPVLGVEAAVLFDVHVLGLEGPPPWQ